MSPEQTSLFRQQRDCLRVAAPFYREAFKAGEMNFFLDQFFKHYFQRFPVPRQDFPNVEAHDAEIWAQEQLTWLRNVGLSVHLPTTWERFIVLHPSAEYADIASNVLAQLDSTRATEPTLRNTTLAQPVECQVIVIDDD
ncbi:hypothetical protein BKA70DRAFT_1218496 [Coprinopsis sp. MPI-PUGE-AT-0042]|nr:hypothetical protein BKA70DRAFT_1218496 [Coprinopsis sp. MPI-PUGE-AT-0042]